MEMILKATVMWFHRITNGTGEQQGKWKTKWILVHRIKKKPVKFLGQIIRIEWLENLTLIRHF